MASGNGVVDARKPEDDPDLPVAERFGVMRLTGWEQIIPTTGRRVRLRTIEPADLLRSGECPDILTPLVLRCIYQELTDRELREWLEKPLAQVDDALKYMEMLDLVVAKGIADDTVVSALSLGEKKWIFRFVLGTAEILVTFRYEPQSDVATVAQGEPSPQAAE